MKTIYKIGLYKNGQQFAKEVFSSEDIEEVKDEFCRMWNATEFDPDGIDNEAESAQAAWYYKHFSEDTSNVAVFACESEDDSLRTIYSNQYVSPNQM